MYDFYVPRSISKIMNIVFDVINSVSVFVAKIASKLSKSCQVEIRRLNFMLQSERNQTRQTDKVVEACAKAKFIY